MIADIDIESEAIRFLGILRNDVWAAWRVIRLRSYRAKFSYLPFDKSGAQLSLPQFQDEVPPHWVSIEADFILFWASHVTHAASNTLQSPESSLDDGKFTILFVR
jgi:sphingosine kinase